MQLLGTGSKQETLDKDMDIDALSIAPSRLSAAEGEEKQRQQCVYVCTCVCMYVALPQEMPTEAAGKGEQRYSCSLKWQTEIPMNI